MKQYTFVDYATQAYSAFVTLLVLGFHNGTVPHWQAIVAAHFAGIAFTHLVIQAYTARPANPVLDFVRHFYPVLFYGWFFFETGLLNRMFLRDYLDPAVIHMEQALFHCQPGVVFMDRMPYLWLSEIFYICYFSYYIMIGGVGIALFIRNRAQFFHYVSVISFVFYVCYLLYIFIPVIGPRLFFGELAGYSLPPELAAMGSGGMYPGEVADGPFFHLMGWIYAHLEAPGAAFPSSHVAISLSTVVFSFLYLPKIRYLHAAVALVLCLSTVYCRYHYGVDVIAGILTAAIFLPVGNWLYFKFGQQAAKRSLVLAPTQPALEEH